MNPMEAMAGQIVWAARNMAHNLDFIPADKLDWKPAPTASSALEIVGHITGVLNAMKPMLSGGSPETPDMTPATSAEEAKQALVSAAEAYAEALRAVKSEDLQRQVDLRFATWPLARAASLPAVDLLHHHGQIAYIQTLLGDTEAHFDMSLM